MRAHGDSWGVLWRQARCLKNKSSEESPMLDNSTTPNYWPSPPHPAHESYCTWSHTGTLSSDNTPDIDLVLYREQSFWLSQHLLVLLFWGSSALWVVMGGRDSFRKWKVMLALCSPLLIRHTPPELWLKTLMERRGTEWQFMLSWCSGNTRHLERLAKWGAAAVSESSQVGSGQWFWNLPLSFLLPSLRMSMSLIVPKPVSPSAPSSSTNQSHFLTLASKAMTNSISAPGFDSFSKIISSGYIDLTCTSSIRSDYISQDMLWSFYSRITPSILRSLDLLSIIPAWETLIIIANIDSEWAFNLATFRCCIR